MADEALPDDLLFFNGVNGATGDYGLPPMTGQELARFLEGEAPPEDLDELRFRFRQQDRRHLGVREGIDPKKLDETGWGAIFAHDADPAVREALAPLLRMRREQAGEHFRIYERGEGYRQDEPKTQFLARHGVGPGPVDPERVPYYLLLVGGPEAVPYRFQTQLDVQYAVGRIHFETLDEYARYAESVVAAEEDRIRLPRRLSLFGAQSADDRATILSTRDLVEPLVEHAQRRRPDWQVGALVGDEARKADLARLLGGEDTPALLFTASHGMEFPNGDPRQLPHQGALLCSDWPGPLTWRGRGPVPQDFYFAGDDLQADAGLAGLIAFHFACYGAGTPLYDEFAKQAFKDRGKLAPHAFLAALPTRMLSHPRGGALAVVGHVERAWSYSFTWQGAGRQTAVFESTLDRLLDGHPVGSAMELFNERYAELSTVLADELEEIEYGRKADPFELAGMWTANNDARGYLILGDPAVRLAVAAPGEAARQRSVPKAAGTRHTESGRRSAPSAPRSSQSLSFSIDDEAPEAASDVRFSAYHPRAVEAGERHKLLVYAHLGAALEAIATDAGQLLGKAAEDYRRSAAEASTALAPGAEITVVPQGEGLAFDPPWAKIVWAGTWQRADFEMEATGERVGHVIEGSIACYLGPLLIADVRLPVVVVESGGEAAAEAESAVHTARVYEAVFASYSHDDTAIVRAMETAYKALGMEYLRDVMTLRSGQSWSDELLAMIERADVFQLFWSEKASRSPYVEQEWRHALKTSPMKAPAFIRPIYWEEPLARVPSALSEIHFARVDLDPLTGASEAPAPLTGTALRAFLSGLDEDLTTLVVSTYAAADPSDPETAGLKARTRVSLTGGVETYLSEEGVEKDSLEMHRGMVSEALRGRLALLRLAAGGKPET